MKLAQTVLILDEPCMHGSSKMVNHACRFIIRNMNLNIFINTIPSQVPII
jgi:hypothetical protein